MDFIPIISSLRRHRTASLLIILEIAFTCAIVCNAVFLIRERIARMDRAERRHRGRDRADPTSTASGKPPTPA